MASEPTDAPASAVESHDERYRRLRARYFRTWNQLGIIAAYIALAFATVLGLGFVYRQLQPLWNSAPAVADKPAVGVSAPFNSAAAQTLAANAALDAYLHRPEVLRRGVVTAGELDANVVAPLVGAGLISKEIGEHAVKTLMDGGKEIAVEAAKLGLAKWIGKGEGGGGAGSMICAPVMQVTTAPPQRVVVAQPPERKPKVQCPSAQQRSKPGIGSDF